MQMNYVFTFQLEDKKLLDDVRKGIKPIYCSYDFSIKFFDKSCQLKVGLESGLGEEWDKFHKKLNFLVNLSYVKEIYIDIHKKLYEPSLYEDFVEWLDTYGFKYLEKLTFCVYTHCTRFDASIDNIESDTTGPARRKNSLITILESSVITIDDDDIEWS